jgi:hypothetical protein
MRTQIIRADDSRLIQVQDTRFIYNWKKAEAGVYPTYKTTRPEFNEAYIKFKKFVQEFDLGEIRENQWEVMRC